MTSEQMAVVQAVTYCVPVAALIVSILTFKSAAVERHERSASEQAGISAKLDAHGLTLDKIEGQQVELLSGYHENHESIARIKAELQELKRRVSELEREMRDLAHD